MLETEHGLVECRKGDGKYHRKEVIPSIQLEVAFMAWKKNFCLHQVHKRRQPCG